jgi:nucleoside-diphosphate-sugar epimerase
MIVRMFADAVMIQLALITALTVRWMLTAAFRGEDVDPETLGQLAWQYVGIYCDRAWPLTLISLVVFFLSGFYTYGRFYQGRYKALVVTQAVSQSFVLYAFISYFFSGADITRQIPRSALILAWGISLGLLVGSRVWARLYEKIVRPEHIARAKAKRAGERRVLVVGGAGYIGSALLPMLLEQGYHVRLLDMMVFGDEPISAFADHPNLEIIRGDFRHVECVVQAMHDVDSVIHLGAIVGDPACNLDEDLTIDINLSATRMVAELAKSAGVEQFIFASTCSVYGACDEMLDERSFVRPVSLYGHTKLASERVLRKMTTDRFHPTIVRFATIYGLSGRTRFDLVVNVLSAKAKIDGVITIHGGDQWRPFIHVEDAARALAVVLDAPRAVISNEIFNVGSNDQNYTIEQIGQIVHEQVLSAEMIVSEGDGDNRNYRVDFSKIRNQLGFRPRWSVEEGVQQVLEAIASGEIVDYQDAKFSNVKFLSEEGTERIARDQWARQLIEDLASQ